MAGNVVTLTFAGDSKSLEKTFDNVGKSSKTMADKLEDTGEKSRGFGKAMDVAGEATDKQEQKFLGTADLLDGLGQAFGLPTEGVTNLTRSFGDMAGGFGQVGPLIGSLGSSLGALATGPVGLVIAGVGLLTAGIIALYKNSETFRDIVSAAFDAVKSVVGPIIDGIGKAVSWVTGLFGGAGHASTDMSESMKAAAEQSQADWDNWNTHVTSQLDDIINPLNRARENSKVALADIKANLTDNVNFYGGWIANLNSLTERGFGKLAEYLYSLGPTAEKAVGEAYKMTDPQLKALQDNITGKLDAAGKIGSSLLVSGINGPDYGKLGTDIGTQLVDGLSTVFAPGSVGANMLAGGGLLTGGLQGRASGGPVSAGSAYVVGEHGPELFVPGMSGAIVPNNAGGGGTTTIQVVLDGRVLTEVVHNGLLQKQKSSPLGLN